MEFSTLIIFSVVLLVAVLSFFNPFENTQKAYAPIPKKNKR